MKYLQDWAIFEGGNAYIEDENGNIISYAEKVNVENINRSLFIDDMFELFRKLQESFKLAYNEPLWPDWSVVYSGEVFNGSSQQFFDRSIPDDEFVKYKPLVGDIDITVPLEHLQPLLSLLNQKKPGWQPTRNIEFQGHNKGDEIGRGRQINAVFNWSDGRQSINVQIDFEGVEFEGVRPSSWAKFGHSSSWDDIKAGFKGVAHKYLLRALFKGVSIDNEAVLLTPKSPETEERAKVSKKNFKSDFRFSHFTFYIENGFRWKYRQVMTEEGEPLVIDGKYAYKEIPTRESKYETSLAAMFSLLFDRYAEPREIEKLKSFVGVTELIKKNVPPRKIRLVFEIMLDLFFSPDAQKLERDGGHLDFKIKWPAIEYLMAEWPGLKGYETEIHEMINQYYENY